MNVSYTVRRNLAAARKPGGPADSEVAMVLFRTPDEPVGQFRHLAIPEELIRFEAGGDPAKEQQVIERELQNVLVQMTAGAVGDLTITKN